MAQQKQKAQLCFSAIHQPVFKGRGAAAVTVVSNGVN